MYNYTFLQILNHLINEYKMEIYYIDEEDSPHIVLRNNKVSASVSSSSVSTDITVSLCLIKDVEEATYTSEWSIYDRMFFDQKGKIVSKKCSYEDYINFIREYFEIRI